MAWHTHAVKLQISFSQSFQARTVFSVSWSNTCVSELASIHVFIINLLFEVRWVIFLASACLLAEFCIDWAYGCTRASESKRHQILAKSYQSNIACSNTAISKLIPLHLITGYILQALPNWDNLSQTVKNSQGSELTAWDILGKPAIRRSSLCYCIKKYYSRQAVFVGRF